MKKDKDRMAHVFVQRELNPQEQKALAEVVTDLSKKVKKIKSREKRKTKKRFKPGSTPMTKERLETIVREKVGLPDIIPPMAWPPSEEEY